MSVKASFTNKDKALRPRVYGEGACKKTAS
jgi:hypothetical protein